jgi:hypothetical protein
MLKRPTLENAWGHFQVSTATFLFLASHPRQLPRAGHVLWPRLGGLHRRLHERLQVKPSQTFVLGPASRVKPVLKPSAAYTGKVKP